MKAKNKIVQGHKKEFRFVKKYGKLYLECLECEYAINTITIKSVQIINVKTNPSLKSFLMKGFVLKGFLGDLGLLSGVLTAKKDYIYKIKITFPNNEIGLAEVDTKIYELLMFELFELL